MTAHLLHRSRASAHDWTAARADPARYAAGLYDYAAPTLDEPSLRAWMVQRLMMDIGLDHDRARELAGRAMKTPRAA